MQYQVHLNEFDGPLDLLLHLIEQAKVDVKDIFISEITERYIALMDEADELDMDTASEFLTMAATLVYIKSRSLLPRPPKEDEDGEEDPEQALIRQLREYKRFREAGAGLAALSEGMKGVFRRLPEELAPPKIEYDFADATTRDLFAAFMAVMGRDGDEPRPELAHEVRADEYTVRGQLMLIRRRLAERTTVSFEELFDGATAKIEMIVTFMALLDMIARQEVILKQKTPYGRITITAGEPTVNDDDYEFMDEVE